MKLQRALGDDNKKWRTVQINRECYGINAKSVISGWSSQMQAISSQGAKTSPCREDCVPSLLYPSLRLADTFLMMAS